MSHRLIVGDALDFMRTLPPASISSVITDPPYASGAFDEAQRQQGLQQGVVREDWFVGDGMGTAGLVWLLRSLSFEAARVLRDGGWFVVFADWRQVANLGPALESSGLRWRSLIVWDKGAGGLGLGFRPQHEMIIALSKGTPEPLDPSATNVLRCKRVAAGDKQHPTQKPVDLLRQLIKATTPEGGTVLDPFCGSGSTLIAAATLGRSSIGIDRAESFVRIAAERLRDEADIAAEAGVYLPPATQPTLFAEVES